MIEIQALLSAFGLSASAGLNAYIPLLTIAVVSRLRPEILSLSAPFDALTSNLAIAVLTVLLLVEVLADKVPVVDHFNDLLGLAVRPTAGAVLFAASTGAVDFVDPQLALVLGFVVAGVTHGAKATARPVVTATTGGLGNPVVSTLEDVAAFLTSIVALLAPIVIGFAVIVFVVMFLWWLDRRRPRPAADPRNAVGPTTT
jgi:hypothetical protein